MATLNLTVHTEGLEAVKKKMARAATKAERELAKEILKDTTPFVPASGNAAGLYIRTRVDDNLIVYPGPYARFLYYGKLLVDPETGSAWAKKGKSKVKTEKDLVFSKAHHPQAQSHWFEASKAQNLDKWIRDAKKAVKHGL